MVIEMELFKVCNSSCDDPLFEVNGDLVLLWACITHEATIYSFWTKMTFLLNFFQRLITLIC